MIIKELTVNKNSLLYEDAVYIFSKTNLIHSEKNAKGKTSLVRLLLYSLGYNIPATKGLKSFNNITTEAIVENNNETYIIKRYFRYITVEEKHRPTTEYILPEQEKELHKKIFNIDNKQIIDNLLGSYYIDQDKGWTLLNRGKVIGDIRFNIENLISGITNSDITEDKEKIKEIEKKIKKYNTLKSVSEYINIIKGEKTESIDRQNINKLINAKNQVIQEINDTKNRIKELREIEQENSLLPRLVEKYSIMITYNNEAIPITRDNILNYSENLSFVEVAKKQAIRQLKNLEKKLASIDEEIDSRYKLFDIDSTIEQFDDRILNEQIDMGFVEKALSEAHSAKKEALEKIHNKLSNNEAIKYMYGIIEKYSKELGISYYIGNTPKFIITNELKGYSGKVLFHTTFIFKLAYISLIKKYTGQILPIIIDSPRSGEITEDAAEKIIDIIKRDYSEHQLIIASIYNFKNLEKDINIIELSNGVFNSLPT